MKINKINIDWLDVVVDIYHSSKKVSTGLTLYLDDDYNVYKAKKSFTPKLVESKSGHTLKIKSLGEKLRISGNFYKWLHGQNVDGSSSVIDLVYSVISELTKQDLVEPTSEQLSVIKEGNFRIYQAHIKQDMIFESKILALTYLEQLKKFGRYPYKRKTIYENGVYFGIPSKRWVLGYYHKGKQLSRQKANKDIITPRLQAHADLMIRSEIKIYSKSLSSFDLIFAWQWRDVEALDRFFKECLSKLILPDFKSIIDLSKIINNADKKFYNCLKTGNIDILYSRATVHRKRLKFMNEYNIDIDSIKSHPQEGI